MLLTNVETLDIKCSLISNPIITHSFKGRNENFENTSTRYLVKCNMQSEMFIKIKKY